MKIIIDGMECEAEKGEYILNIARRNNIEIPTLCHNDALPGIGSCRLCIVEVIENERHRIVTSCVFPVNREIEVVTNSEKIIKMRRTLIMLLAARTPNSRYVNKLKREYNIPDVTRFNLDYSEKCILCGLCVRACESLGSSAISTVNRGVTKKVSTPYDEPSSTCIGCGSCAFVCPVDAIELKEKNGVRRIWNRDFELVRCSECGEYYATREQLEFAASKLGEYKNEITLCEKCRKKAATRNLLNTYRSN